MVYIRKCSSCHNDITYNGINAVYNGKKAEKENRCCKSCVSKKISIKYKGIGNPFYNKKHTAESLEKQSSIKKGKRTSTKTEFKNGHNLNDINNPPNYNLNKIMDNSNESFYWLGFILADGSFYKNVFEFSLQKKDLEHLKKFCLYIGGSPIYEKGNSYRTYFSNKKNNNEFRDIYGINYRKTYNPPDFDIFYKKYSVEQLLALLCGIIDGDGSIYVNRNNHNNSISITFHKNWYTFYEKLFGILNIYCNFAVVKNKNVMTLNICRKKEILTLYDNMVTLNTSYLKRKWETIKKI